MRSKLAINLTTNYSINFDLPKRSKKKIIFIIIHYTGMKNELEAIKKLCDYRSNVSSHYFVKNNGEILNLVPDLYEAWHAGKSSWKHYRFLNKFSIGIEVSNPGHEHGYKKFNSSQISSLIKLLKYLQKKYNVKNQNILGHSDIAPDRKKDPGEKFPWKLLSKSKVCHWHTLKENKIRKYRYQMINKKDQNVFFKNLHKIGYSKMSNSKKSMLIKAFQRRFRQSLINGKVDKECLFISANLVNPQKN